MVSMQVKALNWYSKLLIAIIHGPIVSTATSSHGWRCLIYFGDTCPYFTVCSLNFWQYSQRCTNWVTCLVIWGNQKCLRSVAVSRDMPACPSMLWSHQLAAYCMACGITIFVVSSSLLIWCTSAVFLIVILMKSLSSWCAFCNIFYILHFNVKPLPFQWLNLLQFGDTAICSFPFHWAINWITHVIK